MKKIIICYWRGHIPGMKYKQNEEKKYTSRILLRIIKNVTEKGYNLQLRPNNDTMTVLIDNGRFVQS